MSDTIEVSGEEHELTDNPSLRTVRDVQQMQARLLRDYLDEDGLKELDDIESDGEIMEYVMEEHGMEAVEDLMWDHSVLQTRQTISLACDYCFDSDDFNDMGARDFQEAKEAAEDVLGGDVSDFFEDLGIGTLLNEETAAQVQ